MSAPFRDDLPEGAIRPGVSGRVSFTPEEIQRLADAALPQDRNPFTEPPGIGERLAGVPGNLLKLPFRLLNELIDSPRARRERGNANFQRDIAEQVTGERLPSSEGRRLANILSLGLIPGNPSGEIDPNRLGPSERENFSSLSDLQQQVAQARSAEDFAEILANDKNFEARQPLTPAGAAAVDERSGITPPGSAAAGRLITGRPGQQFEDPITGVSVTPNPVGEEPATGSGLFENPALVGRLSEDFTLESIDRARVTNRATSLERNKGSLKREIKDSAPTRESFLRVTAVDRERVKEFRTFLGAYGQNPTDVPDDIKQVLDGAGVDISNLNDSGLRDVALVFQFMRMLDPTSVVRESEQRLFIDSQGIRAAMKAKLEKIINLDFEGEFLAPETRNEVFRTITGILKSNLSGLELARKEFSDLATRNGIPPEDVVLGEGLSADVISGFKALEEAGKRGPQRTISRENAKQAYLDQGGDPNNPSEFRGFLLANGFKRPQAADGE